MDRSKCAYPLKSHCSPDWCEKCGGRTKKELETINKEIDKALKRKEK